MTSPDYTPAPDPFMAWLGQTIRRVGWALVYIPEDDEGPGFGYTIGLLQSYNHPELLLAGWAQERTQGWLNFLGGSIRDGRTFPPGEPIVVDERGVTFAFRAIHRDHLGEFLGRAVVHYHPREVQALQLFWHDPERRYPWDPDCAESCVTSQPRLDTV